MTAKIVIALNTAWNLINFRGGLIRALVRAGYDVVAVAPADKYVGRVLDLGCRFIPIPIDNKGTNPWRDLLLFWRYWRLLRRERPTMFLGYTIKPNIYGSIAAHTLKISVVNNVAGLGTSFMRNGWLMRLVRQLYQRALSRSARVFFQNEDDLRLFVDGGMVSAKVADRVPGSGIDLDRFVLSPWPSPRQEFRFLLVARMLWDKGVGQYVEAARQVRARHPTATFHLLGFLDVQNPSAISLSQMESWVAEGVINYEGASDDVRSHIADADCVVLPSYYREGVPRSLLEAAAIGRPILTSDAVGCREVVEDGVNGYLCQVRNVSDLAEKMERMINLPRAALIEMGRHGRKKVVREFDERIVIDRYLSAIRAIVENSPAASDGLPLYRNSESSSKV